MENTIKIYKLNKLDCAHCATKIEDEVGKLDGIIEHNLNFVKKTLKITIKNKDTKEITKIINDTVKSIENHVDVEEISLENQKKFKLENLFCASCAEKIEQAILNLDEVKEGSYNFSTQTLKLTLDSKINIIDFKEKLQKLVDSYEDGVKVSIISQNQRKKETLEEEVSHKESIINLIGFALFILALFIGKDLLIGKILFITSYVFVGGDIVLKSFKNINRKTFFDENFLMTLATFGAFAIGEYPEASAVMIFYKIGEFFQSKAVKKSRNSIEDLMDIRPDYANLLINGSFEKVDPEDISIGDIILVKPGEKVPLDGIVTKGTSTLDTSALTGESVPRKVNIGADILSGSINKNGTLEVKVKKAFYDSTASKILELVENASSNKGETEKFITKFSRYYTPIVVIIALFTAIVPSIFFGDFSSWLYRALIFLVISCPCALVVSVPLGFFSGIGNASKKGVLVKGGNYLEALNKLDSIIFDKTGTLTQGKFEVASINPSLDHISENKLLELAALGEINSNHPIAHSIKKQYGKDLDIMRVKNYSEIEGYGISVIIDEKKALIGNKKLFDKEGIRVEENSDYGTIIYVSYDNNYIGNIVIKDKIKEDSAETIKKLKELGKNVYLLTGDNKQVGDRIGMELGIENVYSNLLPQEKVDIFDKIKKNSSQLVAFVGDGINDAPVLAKADIGISMGGLGSDAAIEASDIVLMEDKPIKIISAIQTAKRTRQIVTQNILFALGVKIAIMALGIMGNATMWEAIFADVGVSLLAVLNSTRILKD